MEDMKEFEKELMCDDSENILNTYKRFPVVLKEGKGATLKDYTGKEYIDFSSGIGTNSFGVCDKEWVDAVVHQANTLQHSSNLYYTAPQVMVAKMLCEKTNMKKVFFGNSGAEANECAIKAARKYSYDKYGLGRSEIITLQNSFHGRTIATLSATGQDVFHQWFFPFVGDFKYCPASDIDALKGLISEKTCAIMIETVQGEGGVVALDPKFIKYIDKVCKEKDILFIVDEVQTGNGRCGYLYSYMEYGVTPNIVTTAKGLAGGLPFAAILFDEKTENVLSYGQHGTTFGGNPVCASAAVSVLKRIDDKLLNHVRECRKIIEDRLKDVEEVKSISGKGLMVGIELKDGLKAVDIASKCMEEGLIPLTAKTKIRLLPPLNITFEELNKGLDILIHVLKEA
ncbi:MAG: acetylornithine/succinylornithine family transaminase [Acholeplasmatales bacterium]|nr:acetylornithine/succinylornithine family transaminase [Acholeplasmatales bacterium]